MFRYGKTAQAAVSVVSYLAQCYGGEDSPGAAKVAEVRGLSRALAAKLLTNLSREGLVVGRPGPNGGYRLTRDPETISLRDVVVVFERIDDAPQCPFGVGWCGHGDPCPLHDAILAQKEGYQRFLEETTFAGFKEAS